MMCNVWAALAPKASLQSPSPSLPLGSHVVVLEPAPLCVWQSKPPRITLLVGEEADIRIQHGGEEAGENRSN